ncbi:helix-turn-helix domain-containing protein [Streptomyces sp. NPDC093514]|uniref:helix-turn-helix domain-containing protein n=1 Tax=Streptomyces sp. NPDC093514 TaxID=3366039 RepID=UPI00380F9DD6
MMGVEDLLRLTVAALMTRTGERQNDLADGLGLSQAQVSRKQGGRQHWSLEDVDRLAAHFGLHFLDLLAGPTHAVGVLHGSIPALRPADAVAPAAVAQPAPAALFPTEPAAAAAPVGLCVLCGQPTSAELEGFPQHLTAEECAAAVTAAAPALPPAAPTPAAAPVAVPVEPVVEPLPADAHPAPELAPEPEAPAPQASEPVAPSRPRGPRTYASGDLISQITGAVEEALEEHAGDVEAAQAALIRAAIPDVMALLKASRVGGRYEHSEFPPTAEILRKRSQKGADEIWEGRPKWRNPELVAAAKAGAKLDVTALDMNAAYLSALKCWLPIGQLREDTRGIHDPKKSGVHLITPADWEHADLPNPLGNRMEPGELWVSESTLRLLLDCARQGLADAPTIHRSLVSGATEGLLEKLRRALAETRKNALAEGDELTVAYVKAMYSKLVSTVGESTANRELRRPDWMHIIRAKAFANLWMKANKAHKAGLQVVEISGTDELHVVGDWRSVFSEGRDLNQVKEKNTYLLGGKH